MKKKININKELEFYFGITELKEKYGKAFLDWYWKPNYITNGLPEIEHPTTSMEKDIAMLHKRLEHPRSFTEDEYNLFHDKINYVIHKFKNIQMPNPEINQYALLRYYLVGALSYISLSVLPKQKKEWKIDFEMFGSFYNTNSDYCSLYNDIELSSCDVFRFRLHPNMTLLINPPYSEDWIQVACQLCIKLLKKKKNTTIYLVLPVWNLSDRKKLGLPLYDDLPIIDDMKISPYLIKHSIRNIKFYDGTKQQLALYTDKVHVFIFNH